MTHEGAWLKVTRVALGTAVALFGVLVATGIALTFRYHPEVTDAYTNAGHDTFVTSRRIHQFASPLFVVAVAVLAISSIGMFLVRRARVSIVIPIIVGVAALVAAHTGRLLPWDQLSLRMVTANVSFRGYTMFFNGDDRVNRVFMSNELMSPAAVGRRYWVHAAVVPLVIAGLLGALFAAASRAAKLRGAPDD